MYFSLCLRLLDLLALVALHLDPDALDQLLVDVPLRPLHGFGRNIRGRIAVILGSKCLSNGGWHQRREKLYKS